MIINIDETGKAKLVHGFFRSNLNLQGKSEALRMLPRCSNDVCFINETYRIGRDKKIGGSPYSNYSCDTYEFACPVLKDKSCPICVKGTISYRLERMDFTDVGVYVNYVQVTAPHDEWHASLASLSQAPDDDGYIIEECNFAFLEKFRVMPYEFQKAKLGQTMTNYLHKVHTFKNVIVRDVKTDFNLPLLSAALQINKGEPPKMGTLDGIVSYPVNAPDGVADWTEYELDQLKVRWAQTGTGKKIYVPYLYNIYRTYNYGIENCYLTVSPIFYWHFKLVTRKSVPTHPHEKEMPSKKINLYYRFYEGHHYLINDSREILGADIPFFTFFQTFLNFEGKGECYDLDKLYVYKCVDIRKRGTTEYKQVKIGMFKLLGKGTYINYHTEKRFYFCSSVTNRVNNASFKIVADRCNKIEDDDFKMRRMNGEIDNVNAPERSVCTMLEIKNETNMFKSGAVKRINGDTFGLLAGHFVMRDGRPLFYTGRQGSATNQYKELTDLEDDKYNYYRPRLIYDDSHVELYLSDGYYYLEKPKSELSNKKHLGLNSRQIHIRTGPEAFHLFKFPPRNSNVVTTSCSFTMQGDLYGMSVVVHYWNYYDRTKNVIVKCGSNAFMLDTTSAFDNQILIEGDEERYYNQVTVRPSEVITFHYVHDKDETWLDTTERQRIVARYNELLADNDGIPIDADYSHWHIDERVFNVLWQQNTSVVVSFEPGSLEAEFLTQYKRYVHSKDKKDELEYKDMFKFEKFLDKKGASFVKTISNPDGLTGAELTAKALLKIKEISAKARRERYDGLFGNRSLMLTIFVPTSLKQLYEQIHKEVEHWDNGVPLAWLNNKLVPFNEVKKVKGQNKKIFRLDYETMIYYSDNLYTQVETADKPVIYFSGSNAIKVTKQNAEFKTLHEWEKFLNIVNDPKIIILRQPRFLHFKKVNTKISYPLLILIKGRIYSLIIIKTQFVNSTGQVVKLMNFYSPHRSNLADGAPIVKVDSKNYTFKLSSINNDQYDLYYRIL